MTFLISPWRPGRHSNKGKENPVGTKLIKRFIKQAMGENTAYRRDLQNLIGTPEQKYQL